jgi:hypothetical protein
MVDGKVVVRNHAITTVDEKALIKEAGEKVQESLNA